MICQICNKTFSSKRLLSDHQKRSKNCSNIKNSIDKIKQEHNKEIIRLKQERDKDIEKLKHELDICKQEHNKDIEKLKNERDMCKQERDIYKQERDESNRTLKQLALRPTTTTNNSVIIVGSLDLNPNRINDCVDNNFNVNHVRNGQIGVANFAIEYFLTNNNGERLYIPTDTSRNSYTFKGRNGELLKDKEAAILTKSIYEPIRSKSWQIVEPMMVEDVGDDFDQISNGYLEISDLHVDNKEFCKKLNRELQT